MTAHSQPGWVELLAQILRDSPRLRDGACVGREDLFDPAREDEAAEDVEYRHSRARRICRTCPVLVECREWVEQLKPSQRPVGVVHGEVLYMRFEKRSAA